MRRTSRIRLLAVGALVVLGALAGLSSCRNSAQGKLERTRRALRQEGFKLELAEFQFEVPPEESARAAALDAAGELSSSSSCWDGGSGRLSFLSGVAQDIDWLPAAGTNAALVLWDEPNVETRGTNDLWGGLRRLNQAMLDRACQALFSGPHRFPLPRVKGGRMEYAGDWAPWLACPLAARALLELHDRNQARAWTNLLALTRLVAGWRAQPFAQFYTWRDRNLRVAYGATWQAVQAGGWNDAQLEALQREWESADVRSGLPEMAAFARAHVKHVFSHRLPLRPRSQQSSPLLIFRDPELAWERLTVTVRRTLADIRYLHYGKYDDEEVLLRFLRDCEKDYRRAEACSTWKQITELPGVGSWTPGATNLSQRAILRTSGCRVRVETVIGLDLVCGFAFEPAVSGPPPAPSRLGRVANWESRRRLLVTAIAIERYRLCRGAYPESLDSLAPELLPSPPLDFMDGKPLRYRRTEDAHFLLYAIGTDCTNDGGNGRVPGLPSLISDSDAPDLVWPRPASPAEVGQEAAARRRLTRNANEMTTFVP